LCLRDGFTRIIDHIKQRFDVDYAFANTLEVRNGKFTRRILGEILDGQQKMCYPSGSCSKRKYSSRTSYCSR
jgi:phosphoserine phosphatase